jgi:deaminated glutathione amidase
MRAGGSGRSSDRTAAPRTGRDAIGRSTLQIDWSVNEGRSVLRAAAVQLECSTDVDRNLGEAERLVRDAAADRATLVVLPERLDIRGAPEQYAAKSESLEGRIVAWARGLAAELGIDLVAGSIAERREGHERVANTSVHAGPDGEIKAVYRKIHMFDVEVGGVEYRESEYSEPAEQVILSETAEGLGLGLTICYDLRFPELYRILALQGARIITVPANFTRITGEAHWEVLLRARAIENQVFVVASGQGRGTGPETDSYGNSMIVDPWGEVLARAGGEGACFVAADLDLARQDEIREQLPSLANRVAAAYRWPETVRVP